MEALIYLTLALLCCSFAGVLAFAARALREFRRTVLEEIFRDRDQLQVYLEVLHWRDRDALVLESFQHWLLFSYCLCSAGLWIHLVGGVSGNGLSLFGGAIVSFLLWTLCTSWLPWTGMRIGAEAFLSVTWPSWHTVGKTFAWITFPARLPDLLLHWALEKELLPYYEVSSITEICAPVSDKPGEPPLLEPTAREMIESVIELGDLEVAAVMTPRTDMVMLSAEATFDEALQLITEQIYTRIPVYEKTRDNIVGILHAKDLLAAIHHHQQSGGTNGAPKDLRDILQEPQFVPKTKKINLLLQEFRQSRKHMAIVLDEFGGVAGLVTIEDVLEEIVGEIADEYDEQEVQEIQPIDQRTYEVAARVHIDELNEALHLNLPESGDFDTLGGFVFSTLGYVPDGGEEVIWENLRLTVLEASRRRIERVRLEILDAKTSDEPANENTTA